MAGLREKQKAQRRSLIEQAAGALFEERGFDRTTIEEIADKALVSPATVYNYYGSKGELLLALVARGEESTEESLPKFLARAESEEPADLLSEIILANVDGTLSMLSKEVWGHVVAFIATTPDPAIAPRYLDTIADSLARSLDEVLQRYMTLGLIKSSVDSNYLAYLLTRLERVQFLNYVYLKDLTRQQLQTAIRKDVAFMVDNLRPDAE